MIPASSSRLRIAFCSSMISLPAARRCVGWTTCAARAGACVVGAGVFVEKVYQGGGNRLREAGMRIESLARITAMSPEAGVTFRVTRIQYQPTETSILKRGCRSFGSPFVGNADSGAPPRSIHSPSPRMRRATNTAAIISHAPPQHGQQCNRCARQASQIRPDSRHRTAWFSRYRAVTSAFSFLQEGVIHRFVGAPGTRNLLDQLSGTSHCAAMSSR